MPSLLSKQYELLDEDNVLRPTIIKPGATWTKTETPSLIGKANV